MKKRLFPIDEEQIELEHVHIIDTLAKLRFLADIFDNPHLLPPVVVDGKSAGYILRRVAEALEQELKMERRND